MSIGRWRHSLFLPVREDGTDGFPGIGKRLLFGVAFRHEPFNLKRHVRRARHGLAAQDDEGLTAKDRLRHSGRSVDDVGMQPAGKAVPVPSAQRIEGRGHDVRGLVHER